MTIQARDKKQIDPVLYAQWMEQQIKKGPCSCDSCKDHSRALRAEFGIPDEEGAAR